MKSRTSLLLFGGLLWSSLLPAALPAQDEEFQVLVSGRPRLGVSVDVRADAEKDKIGARIRDVLPTAPPTRPVFRPATSSPSSTVPRSRTGKPGIPATPARALG